MFQQTQSKAKINYVPLSKEKPTSKVNATLQIISKDSAEETKSPLKIFSFAELSKPKHNARDVSPKTSEQKVSKQKLEKKLNPSAT